MVVRLQLFVRAVAARDDIAQRVAREGDLRVRALARQREARPATVVVVVALEPVVGRVSHELQRVGASGKPVISSSCPSVEWWYESPKPGVIPWNSALHAKYVRVALGLATSTVWS